MKAIGVLLLCWLIAGVVLFAANAICGGDACSEGQWYGTILGLIAWGVVGLPLILASGFVFLTWINQRLPR
jgi:hypothetical protein